MSRYLLLLLFFPLHLWAQESADPPREAEYTEEAASEDSDEVVPYKAPPLAPVAMREIREEDWKKAEGSLDYSKDLPKPPEPEKTSTDHPVFPAFNWGGLSSGMGAFLQVLAILFALGAISYGIYRMMMQKPQNRVIAADGTEITLANLEEYLHETDLERFLREALAASNWPLAVRLYFLQTIKLLSEKDAINWSKEKTNRDYLREMSQHRMSAAFRELTREYERIWYGNQSLPREKFERLELAFKTFYAQL